MSTRYLRFTLLLAALAHTACATTDAPTTGAATDAGVTHGDVFDAAQIDEGVPAQQVAALLSDGLAVELSAPAHYVAAEPEFFAGLTLAPADGIATGLVVARTGGAFTAVPAGVRLPVPVTVTLTWDADRFRAVDPERVALIAWRPELGTWIAEPLREVSLAERRVVAESTRLGVWQLVELGAGVTVPRAVDAADWGVAPTLEDLAALPEPSGETPDGGDKALRSILFRVKGGTSDTVCVDVEGAGITPLALSSPGNFAGYRMVENPGLVRWRVVLSSAPDCSVPAGFVYPDAAWRMAIGDLYATSTSCTTSSATSWIESTMTTKRAGMNTGTEVCPATTSLLAPVTVEFRVTDFSGAVSPGEAVCLAISGQSPIAMAFKTSRYTKGRGVLAPAHTTFRFFVAGEGGCATEARPLGFDDATFLAGGVPMTASSCVPRPGDEEGQSFRIFVAAGGVVTVAGTEECASGCGPGTYPDGVSCAACAAGTVSESGESCVACPPGTEADAEQATCVLCPVGSANGLSAGTCEPCPEGRAASTVGQIACDPCGPGTVSAPDRSSCVSCAEGTYSTEGLECVACPAGFISGVGAAVCVACPAGRAPNPGQSECVVCDAGTFGPDGSACLPCPGGTVSAAGAAGCVPCDPGREPSAGQTACDECPAGTASGGLSCDACPAGTFAAETGSASCSECPIDSVSTPSRVECAPCGLGETSVDGETCVCDPLAHADDDADCGCTGPCGALEACGDGLCAYNGPPCGDGEVDESNRPTSLTLAWEGVGCGGPFGVTLQINGTDVGPFSDDSGCFAGSSPRRVTIDDQAVIDLLLPGVSNTIGIRDPASSSDGLYWAKLRFNGSAQTVVLYEAAAGAASAEAGIPCCAIPASVDTSVTATPAMLVEEYCDDGNGSDGDGCSPECLPESAGYCGDGAVNGSVPRTSALTFSWNLRNCETVTPSTAVTLSINGVDVATTVDDMACYCGQGATSLTVDDPSALALLVPGETNTFGFRTDDAAGAVTAWAKVTLDDTGDDVVIYEYASGAAVAEASHSCTDPYIEVDRVVVASNALLFGPEPCDDGNGVEGDTCDSNCTAPVCGNGVASPGEECDDGEAGSSACDTDCTLTGCGDGTLNALAGEQCDDGDLDPGDGCDADCAVEFCGDGVLQPGEECEDGNDDSGDGCSFACAVEVCGDGAVNVAGEECDDGNADGGDGCSATCQKECGDGVGGTGATTSVVFTYLAASCGAGSQFTVTLDGDPIESFPVTEGCVCTPGVRTYAVTNTALRAAIGSGDHTIGVVSSGTSRPLASWVTMTINGSLVVPVFDYADGIGATDLCVTGYAEVSGSASDYYREACDDGNNAGGDGCSATCDVEACGNGLIEGLEACDDGDTAAGDRCSATCTISATCGDGTVSGDETCDTSGASASCDDDCTAARCGDGKVNATAGEQCDAGDLRSGDGCSSSCQTEECGNGTLDVGEACDDGDLDGGDGCSASCTTEACVPGTDTDGDRLDDCAETRTARFISPSDTGTDPTRVDSDGDGLPDGDEVLGTPAGLNLPGFGADPNRYDVFLEVDYLEPGGCATHRPDDATIAAIVRLYAEAPVTNRDGSRGIALHVDYGQGGGFDGGNEIPGRAGVYSDGGLGAQFHADKAVHFAANRADYFHYTVIAQEFSATAAGLGEVPGDDTVNANGCDTGYTLGAIMAHELGHNMGLQHGGDAACNYKPNYLSIMNYLYSYNTDFDCDGVGDGLLYRYSTGPNAALNENALNEALGVCNGIPRDWDGDASIESSVSVDINGADSDQVSTCGGTKTTLTDHDDWGNMFFYGPVPPGAARVASEVVVCDGL